MDVPHPSRDISLSSKGHTIPQRFVHPHRPIHRRRIGGSMETPSLSSPCWDRIHRWSAPCAWSLSPPWATSRCIHPDHTHESRPAVQRSGYRMHPPAVDSPAIDPQASEEGPSPARHGRIATALQRRSPQQMGGDLHPSAIHPAMGMGPSEIPRPHPGIALRDVQLRRLRRPRMLTVPPT